MRSLLVIAPAQLGDMVMAQSLFKLRKSADPGCAIDVLASGWMLPLLERLPEVRTAIELPAEHGELKLGVRRRVALELRERGYEQAIVLPDSLHSALVPFWARIPLRTGYAGRMRQWLLNDCRLPDIQQLPQTVQHFAALGLPEGAALPQPLPRPALVSTPQNQEAAAQRLGVSNHYQPVLALCPGAGSGPATQWPEEYFAAVARHWLEQDWHVWLFGADSDAEVCRRINALTGDGCHNLAGRTSLDEALDLLAMSTFVVSNASGLMHLAAALQRPMVAIFGATDPLVTPPLAETAQVERLALECSPCGERECPLGHLNCLMTLAPERIMAAMEEVMKR